MSTDQARPRRIGPADKITKADILGAERRWRRGPAPVPAGGSLAADGTPDYGIFGPGSMVWEVLLHPALVVFHHAGQQLSQAAYAPIEAGIRDWEPISMKGRAGELTIFDAFERASRGAGMHLPMWLGDTATAERSAAWLHKIHGRVKGDLIDTGRPELGGYDAAGPREVMWAALTELHPMLRMYEAFAYRGGKSPRRLTALQRDQFIREVGAYLRLHGAREEEIPTSMSELAALYRKYDELFYTNDTLPLFPETGQNYSEVNQKSIAKNFKLTHLKAMRPILVVYLLLRTPVLGALPRRTQEILTGSVKKAKRARFAAKAFLPVAWLLQRRPIERHYMRLMWGPDGVMLFESARKLHAEAKARQAGKARA